MSGERDANGQWLARERDSRSNRTRSRKLGGARLQNVKGCWLIFARRLPGPNSLRSLAEPGIGRGTLIGYVFVPSALNGAFVQLGKKLIKR
jgi:hypothetical protein